MVRAERIQHGSRKGRADLETQHDGIFITYKGLACADWSLRICKKPNVIGYLRHIILKRKPATCQYNIWMKAHWSDYKMKLRRHIFLKVMQPRMLCRYISNDTKPMFNIPLIASRRESKIEYR